MGSGNSNEFDRMEYLRSFIVKFLQSQHKAKSEVVGSLNLINRTPNSLVQSEKKQILERLDRLFNKPEFVKFINREMQINGIAKLNDVLGDERRKTLQEISELSKKLTDRISEIILGDLKRTYNMSRLASTGMVSTVQAPDGTTRKDIDYKPHPIISKDITDLLGETISIQYIGRLDYKCNPSANNYISIFNVSKHVKDEIVMEPRELFSNIDMNLLDNSDYKDTIANTLLSKNNIELSHVDGYIGEIHPQSTLKPGSEQFSSEFYTYQISPKYALVYDGEKIEAVRAYKEQKQQSKEQGEER